MLRLTNYLRCYLSTTHTLPGVEVKTDKYNALHITPKEEVESNVFNQYIANLLKDHSSNGTTSIWVHLNGRQLALVSDLVNDHQFDFHRGKGKSMSLYRWLLPDRKDMVVPYSMFHVGCGGVIVQDNSILLIEEKRVRDSRCRASSRADTAFPEEGQTSERVSSNVRKDKSSNRSE